MSEFNPYHIWLGISETARPIPKYRLLGIDDFENNRDVISAAAEQRTIYLRTLQAGEHEVLVARLLNEISQARVTLLAADQKAAYDEELRKQQTPEPDPEPIPPPIPVVQTPTPAPTPVVIKGTVTQEFPVSIVPTVKNPHSKVQKEIWKQPVVIGVSLVGVIAVLVLFISLMFSGDAEPAVRNSAAPVTTFPPLVTSPPSPEPELTPPEESLPLEGTPLTKNVPIPELEIEPETFAEALAFGKEYMEAAHAMEFEIRSLPATIAVETDEATKNVLIAQLREARNNYNSTKAAAASYYQLALTFADGDTPFEQFQEVQETLKKLRMNDPIDNNSNPSTNEMSAEEQYQLGKKYYDGNGVNRDYKEALKWFRLAADQGNAQAQNNLAIMYRYGRGVAQDFEEALKWYRLAADQGHAGAANAIADKAAADKAAADKAAADKAMKPAPKMPPFNTVKVTAGYPVEVIQGKTSSISINGPAKARSLVATSVVNGIFKLGWNLDKNTLIGNGRTQVVTFNGKRIVVPAGSGLSIINGAYFIGGIPIDLNQPIKILNIPNPPSVVLTVPTLHTFIVEDNGNVMFKDVDIQNLNVTLLASGNIQILDVNANRLTMQISGSGLARVTGKTGHQKIVLSGSGVMDARQLFSNTANVSIMGSGDAYVRVRDEVDVLIQGSGDLTLWGMPNIKRSIMGSGQLIKRQ
jgi:TPR repeat protein